MEGGYKPGGNHAAEQEHRAVPPLPDEQDLKEIALAHVARFSTTRKNLHSVLQRRLKRWASRAVQAGMLPEEAEARIEAVLPVIDTVLENMVQIGAVDDAGFARSRARSMTRTGRSRKAVAASLIVKGVSPDMADQALDESLGLFSASQGQDAELAAALVLARKRNLGPFARPSSANMSGQEEQDFLKARKEKMRILAVFARNGFSQDIARKVLEMERDVAEDHIIAFRSAL